MLPQAALRNNNDGGNEVPWKVTLPDQALEIIGYPSFLFLDLSMGALVMNGFKLNINRPLHVLLPTGVKNYEPILENIHLILNGHRWGG